MYLVISEKPRVAQSIAKVIGAYKKEDGYLSGRDCLVSWCLGHLADYAMPEAYDEKYGTWSFEDLPIIPNKWKLKVARDKKEQFSVTSSSQEATTSSPMRSWLPSTVISFHSSMSTSSLWTQISGALLTALMVREDFCVFPDSSVTEMERTPFLLSVVPDVMVFPLKDNAMVQSLDALSFHDATSASPTNS